MLIYLYLARSLKIRSMDKHWQEVACREFKFLLKFRIFFLFPHRFLSLITRTLPPEMWTISSTSQTCRWACEAFYYCAYVLIKPYHNHIKQLSELFLSQQTKVTLWSSPNSANPLNIIVSLRVLWIFMLLWMYPIIFWFFLNVNVELFWL